MTENRSEGLVQADASAPALSEKVIEADEQLPEVCGCISSDAVRIIRELLTAQHVPVAAFIDDHVGNAIAQRNILADCLLNIRKQIDAALADAKVTFSDEAERDAVSLKQNFSAQPNLGKE